MPQGDREEIEAPHLSNGTAPGAEKANIYLESMLLKIHAPNDVFRKGR